MRPRSSGDDAGAAVARLRVLIADGDAEFTREFAELLRRDPRLEVVEVASSPDEALAGAERLAPDVVLIGEFPSADIGELTRAISRQADVALILLVRTDAPEALVPGARAAAFLRRSGRVEEVARGFFEIASLARELVRRREEDQE